MKQLMRYRIISGRVVEKRDVLLDVSREKKPRGKRRGKSLASQIERNMREAVRNLARLLNCNFRGGDLLLTLKYDAGRLPENKAAARRELRNFLRRIGRAYKARTGKKLRYVAVTADRDSGTGETVRLHHHLVLDPLDWEIIAANWPPDQFSYRRLDGSGDYTAIALYLIRNTGYQRGERSWSGSRDLARPVFTAPEPVKELGHFRIPKEARVAEREIRENEEDGFRGAYIRYVVPEDREAGRDRPGREERGA